MLKNHTKPVDLNSGGAFDEIKLESLIDSADSNKLMEFIRTRTDSFEFRNKLEERDALRQELAKSDETYQIVKGYAPNENLVRAKGTSVEIREASVAYRNIFEQLAVVLTELDTYRAITARAAEAYSTIRTMEEKSNGKFLEFTQNKIGDLVEIGSYESGSPEWHEQRAEGIGGSDIGSIMRVEPEYASVNYSRVLNSKLGIPEKENEFSGKQDETTPIGRGNAWEEAIRQRCADENPELSIAFCKSSWAGKGKRAYQRCNFDGLILDTAGNAIGVVEVKTGSDASKWGPVSEGIWAVPAGYRKQILWYAALGKLKFGKLVVLIDDHDYREYDFSMDDPAVKCEVTEIMKAAQTFWNKVIVARADKTAGKKSSRARIRGFGRNPDYNRVAEILSAYSGENPRKTKALVLSEVGKIENKLGRPLEAYENQKLLTKLFAAHNPSMRGKPLYGVDIETSKGSPRAGRIIETGIVEVHPDSPPKIVYSELHGLSETVLRGAGLGFEDLHGISEKDLDGKLPFDHPQVQEEILTYLMSGVMVAHNAGFEDRFFIANLEGYAEARDAGLIIILDTRVLSTMLMPASSDSSLNSFAEDNGVPYEGAHAAAADALMMMKGLQNLQKTLYNKGKFVAKRVTKTSRREAIKNAIVAEASR